MVKRKELLKAARLLAENCINNKYCDDCPFDARHDVNKGIYCYLLNVLPESWALIVDNIEEVGK